MVPIRIPEFSALLYKTTGSSIKLPVRIPFTIKKNTKVTTKDKYTLAKLFFINKQNNKKTDVDIKVTEVYNLFQ